MPFHPSGHKPRPAKRFRMLSEPPSTRMFLLMESNIPPALYFFYSFKHQFIAFRMSRCIIGCPSDSGV